MIVLTLVSSTRLPVLSKRRQPPVAPLAWLRTPTRPQRLHPCAGLLSLALLAAEVTVGRRAFPFQADDGEPLAALFAPHASLFHLVLPSSWLLA